MNNKGFVVAATMILMPVILALFFLTYSTVGLIQWDLRLNHSCRNQLLQTQSKVAPLLKSLLALNPLAIKLRQQKLAAEKALQAAVASGLPQAIAAAKLRLFTIEMKRLELQMKQLQLIRSANQLMALGQTRSSADLRKTAMEVQKSTLGLMKTDFQLKPTYPKTLAVRPEYPDIAPPYVLQLNFKQQQALEQNWQYEFKMRGAASSFLKGQAHFTKNCSVTLTEEKEKWFAQIHEAKSTLNSFM